MASALVFVLAVIAGRRDAPTRDPTRRRLKLPIAFALPNGYIRREI
jgi:hypothetical protein